MDSPAGYTAAARRAGDGILPSQLGNAAQTVGGGGDPTLASGFEGGEGWSAYPVRYAVGDALQMPMGCRRRASVLPMARDRDMIA